jgi:DNA-binding Lrp family transcriptional regulator
MKLSLTQKKILKLLTINCRFSNKDIAQAIGISADTVNYQIEKLVAKEKLGAFSVQFDYRLLGFDHFHFLIRLKDPDDIPFEKLITLKGVTFINTAHGKYDIQLIVVARDAPDFDEQSASIYKILGDSIIDFIVIKFHSQLKYSYMMPDLCVPVKIPKKPKSAVYSLARENFCAGFSDTRIALDDTDRSIIKELLHDPRESYLEISLKAGVSHETVRQRIEGYVKKRFITTFGLWNDYSRQGYFANFMLMKVKDFDENNFKEFLDQKKYVFYSAKLIGDYNLIIYLVSKTPEDFGKQTKEIRGYFKEKLLSLDLLYFDELKKNVQFPAALLR